MTEKEVDLSAAASAEALQILNSELSQSRDQISSLISQMAATHEQIGSVRHSVEAASANILQCDHEIDDIQVRMAQKERPFYKDVSLLVAVFAFVLSLATTLIGELRMARQNRGAKEAELREVIRRLVAIPHEQAQLIVDLENKPDVLNSVIGDLQSENNVLAARAIVLIDQLGDEVTATEREAVVKSLISAIQFHDAKRILQKAIALAKQPNEAAVASRQLGMIHFLEGDPKKARAAMKKAILAPKSGELAYHYAAADCETYTIWAKAEMLYGSYDLAQERLKDAESAANLVPLWPMKTLLLRQVGAAHVEIEKAKTAYPTQQQIAAPSP